MSETPSGPYTTRIITSTIQNVKNAVYYIIDWYRDVPIQNDNLTIVIRDNVPTPVHTIAEETHHSVSIV